MCGVFSPRRALSEDFENEIAMRKLFAKARSQTRHLLKEQLADFGQKRALGLGNLYGPSDAELGLCLDNRNKELKCIDEYLVPLLDSLR